MRKVDTLPCLLAVRDHLSATAGECAMRLNELSLPRHTGRMLLSCTMKHVSSSDEPPLDRLAAVERLIAFVAQYVTLGESERQLSRSCRASKAIQKTPSCSPQERWLVRAGS